jgi:hypothetical protein
MVYFNDFESGEPNSIETYSWLNGSFGPTADKRIVTYNGSKMLGRFNNGLILLNLTGLPPHQVLQVEFDLYIEDKWRNDLWKMTFDGADVLLTGFSNIDSVKQAYPNWLGNGTSLSPAGANAQNTQLPGFCSLASAPNGTSIYRIVRTIEHKGDTFQFVCSDAGGVLNDFCQRSWSLDNLKISVIRN